MAESGSEWHTNDEDVRATEGEGRKLQVTKKKYVQLRTGKRAKRRTQMMAVQRQEECAILSKGKIRKFVSKIAHTHGVNTTTNVRVQSTRQENNGEHSIAKEWHTDDIISTTTKKKVGEIKSRKQGRKSRAGRHKSKLKREECGTQTTPGQRRENVVHVIHSRKQILRIIRSNQIKKPQEWHTIDGSTPTRVRAIHSRKQGRNSRAK